jgi:acetyl-CoA acetyltransferase
MEIKEVVIVSGCRTAIGKFLGGLKDVPARDLAVAAGKSAVERAGIEADMVDEICMGQVYGGMQVGQSKLRFGNAGVGNRLSQHYARQYGDWIGRRC